MQKWAHMAVHANSCRKHPLRPVARTQFRFESAPTKAGALQGLESAVRAWDAMSRRSAPEQRRVPTLLTP
jgi:hypothetical protein